MARKGHGRPADLVNLSSHPDDGSSPVGSNEWNKNRDTTGIMGFTKKTEAIDGSNNINITDSYVEVTNAGTIHTMSQVTTALSTTYYPSDTTTKSFAEGDLLYIVKASGVGTVNLNHQQGGAGAGKITTLSGGVQTLDEKVPRIFMCRTIGSNQEWIEYGGGSASDLDTTNFASGIIDTDLTSVAGTDTTIPSAKATKAFAEARANHTGTQAASTISDFDTEVSNNSSVAANTAKVTNATHTGDVTGSTTLTYNNAVPVAKGGTTLTGFTTGDVLYASSSTALAKLAKPSSPDGEVLTFANGASAPSWAAASGGGAHTIQEWTSQSSAPSNPSVGTPKMYVKTIDTNNEGLFIKMEKNNEIVEVQIA